MTVLYDSHSRQSYWSSMTVLTDCTLLRLFTTADRIIFANHDPLPIFTIPVLLLAYSVQLENQYQAITHWTTPWIISSANITRTILTKTIPIGKSYSPNASKSYNRTFVHDCSILRLQHVESARLMLKRLKIGRIVIIAHPRALPDLPNLNFTHIDCFIE